MKSKSSTKVTEEISARIIISREELESILIDFAKKFPEFAPFDITDIIVESVFRDNPDEVEISAWKEIKKEDSK